MIGDQTQTTTATSNFSNTSSANSSSNYKYNGLVKVPFFQVLYRDLGSLFSYIQITTPPYSIIHHVMTVFRIFQTIGPCIHFCNFLLWPKDTLAGKTSSWISIFFQIVPADYMGIIRNSACIIFLVISISMSIIVLLCCGYYKKKATMPGFWSSLIYIYYSSIPHILHLPIATCICVTVSEIIFLNTSLSIIEIIVFIVCLVMILVQIFFVTLLNEQTIAFKPQSMMTVTPTTWNFQFYISMEVTIVTAFISQASDDAVLYSIVILLSTVFYGLMTRLPFYKGGFASPFVDAIILSIGVYGVIMNLILTAFTALKRDISLLVIFFMVGSFFVVYIGCPVM
ncbi:hypothetical protein TRFO_29581 [Tritrichomonas foetus]|uniref:Uncharacterized protein n=1 Tax=Tritrichomonas foetus TaxID=1144522 RepID=A0A1J4JVN3_9EUKA|nr:hypothetical protein TRFO_29581 [Tritrichomonas foetus]|eukprot:OHT03075.1 hypothetical protein TRFO_29581 [Tritrichomonas foetus]